MIRRFLCKLLYWVFLIVGKSPKIAIGFVAVLLLLPFLGIAGAKIYQNWDDDPDRGALAVTDGVFGESYATPEYLDQGWTEADSLWFYNTTQGSGLMPYDFLLALEQPDKKGVAKVECERDGAKAAWFLCDNHIDRYRYLPQKKSLFNPDALPVGFVKEPYKGKDYVGYTCAACHTGQINFKNPDEKTARALRIDGGPAMADMVGFLKDLEVALEQSQTGPKWETFVGNVLNLDNDYDSQDDVKEDLKKWADVIELYNTVNNSTYKRRKVEYGYARLDAFGRIYNRVLQHLVNRKQFAIMLGRLQSVTGEALLTPDQIDNVLAGVDQTVIGDTQFALILDRLKMPKPDYPDLSNPDLLRLRDEIFNKPNAPVSYPFLWDIAQSDYVQWNGLAGNAPPGPLGRNAGEVIGVFGILDWAEDKRWLSQLLHFSFSGWISGQSNKRKQIRFDSSIDLFNLQRLESHLRHLKSPQWPFCWDAKKESYYLPDADKNARPPEDQRPCRKGGEHFDGEAVKRGEALFEHHCQSCHEVIERDDWDRRVIAHMSSLRKAGTDKAMAANSVDYGGRPGNFRYTYQDISVGKVLVQEKAPVIELLTAATRGVVATPDPDKWWPRRIVEYLYTVFMSFAENPIKGTIKRGKYDPDTTADPYASLEAYKARSLNGIWATAPYLHNGSVPDLYELLLPVRRQGDVDGGRCPKYRRDIFVVGGRTFDPKKVGFLSDGYDGFKFKTDVRGNRNTGHDYGACERTDRERWDLIEYLKTL